MFVYRVVYRKHGCEEVAAGHNLGLRIIENTTGVDVRVVTAGTRCAMFVETYGKKMATDTE